MAFPTLKQLVQSVFNFKDKSYSFVAIDLDNAELKTVYKHFEQKYWREASESEFSRAELAYLSQIAAELEARYDILTELKDLDALKTFNSNSKIDFKQIHFFRQHFSQVLEEEIEDIWESRIRSRSSMVKIENKLDVIAWPIYLVRLREIFKKLQDDEAKQEINKIIQKTNKKAEKIMAPTTKPIFTETKPSTMKSITEKNLNAAQQALYLEGAAVINAKALSLIKTKSPFMLRAALEDKLGSAVFQIVFANMVDIARERNMLPKYKHVDKLVDALLLSAAQEALKSLNLKGFMNSLFKDPELKSILDSVSPCDPVDEKPAD